jgi:acyl-CoA thioesterase-1
MTKLKPILLCISILALSLATAGCDEKPPSAPKTDEAEHEAAKPAGQEGIIAAVGDSLTAGFGLSEKEAYPARLEQRLLAEGYRYRVVNAGISGETSSGTLSRIKWVLTLKPDIVILETGANDGLRGIPTDLIESNLNETIRNLKEHNVIVVLAGMQILGNLGRDYATAFKEIYPRVAEKQGAILIPFFLESVAGEPRLNLPDAIHPTAEGHEIVTDTVYPYVVEAIRKRGAK